MSYLGGISQVDLVRGDICCQRVLISADAALWVTSPPRQTCLRLSYTVSISYILMIVPILPIGPKINFKSKTFFQARHKIFQPLNYPNYYGKIRVY